MSVDSLLPPQPRKLFHNEFEVGLER